jgi:peptide-methionine (S)-S-oxide reductase
METATFGAGCFWGVQAAFDRVKGVVETQVGYAGGVLANPTYQDVCTGKTGHAEVLQVAFDPKEVPYERLLAVFFENHDPTQMNRQGPDVGTQYRSVVFLHSPEQERAARAAVAKEAASGRHPRPVVTAVEKAGPFWRAEEYHQKYLEKRGLAICH